MNVAECLKQKNHTVKVKYEDPFKVTFYSNCNRNGESRELDYRKPSECEMEQGHMILAPTCPTCLFFIEKL